MESDRKMSVLLPDCLCENDLPHTEEHVAHLPQQLMPALQLPDTSTSLRDEDEQRTSDLLNDLKKARSEDVKLNEMFEKRAQMLWEELKNIPDQKETPDVWWDGFAVNDGNRLKYQLDHLSFQLANERNQLHSLKKELNIYRKLIRQEVGSDMSLNQLLTSKNWKGRAEEIERLKKEIANMEAKAYGHKYLKNPLCFPEYNPRFPRVDDLVPPRQAEYLKREALKKKEKEDEFDKEISSFMKEYGDLAMMYKASVTHNKGLASELRLLKEQHKIYEDKAIDDISLIKKLVTHQMQMKELLDRENHLNHLVEQNQSKDMSSADDEGMDAAKYKALYETSEYKKQAIMELIQCLTDRLNEVIAKTEEAFNHAERNLAQQKELEQIFERAKEEAKTAGTKAKGKKKTGPKTGNKQSLQATELDALLEENNFLKQFLQTEIEFKEKDLELYMRTMNNVRKQYLDTLEKVRGKDKSTNQSPEDAPKN